MGGCKVAEKKQWVIAEGKDRVDIVTTISEFLIALPPGSWRVEVCRHRNQRSTEQLAYLWGVAYELLSDATGYEKQDIHEYLCMMHFGSREKKLPGNRIESVPLRTTTENERGERDVLDKPAFCEFVAFVQRFGAYHGIMIPDPVKEYAK